MTNAGTHIWHADEDLAGRYADGSLPEPEAWSLETHVERCSGCAALVSRAVRATAAGPLLAEMREAVLGALPVAASVSTSTPLGCTASASTPLGRKAPAAAEAAVPAPGVPAWGGPVREHRPAEAGFTRSGALSRLRGLPRSARLTRRHPLPRSARLLWAAGPAVRGAWLPAVLVVAAGAMALGLGGGFSGTRALLLAIAPVVPVAGVALSYGPHADPMYEVAAASPGGGLRLALTRTLAVLAVSLPLLTFTGLLLPASGAPAAAAWLLPGLALTLVSLALASFVGCRTATGVTAGGWLCAVLAPTVTAPAAESSARVAEQLSRCLDGAGTQGAWAAAAALSAVLLTVRRSAFDNLLPR